MRNFWHVAVSNRRGHFKGIVPAPSSVGTLEDVLMMHSSIMRDPTTIPTVVSAGGGTYNTYYSLHGSFIDAHASGYTYGPLASHPQEANIDATATGPGNESDLQAVLDAQAVDAVIGIDGTFTGTSNGTQVTPKASQVLVGVGTTGVLDNIAVGDVLGLYNLTVRNVIGSTPDAAANSAVYLANGATMNHCDLLNNGNSGVKVAPNCAVEYNRSSGNGRYGLDGYGVLGNAEGSTVRYNEIRNNNTDGNPDTVAAGAMKFVQSPDAVMHDNWFVDNRGNGIWFDNQNDRTLIEWNLCEENDEAGVFYEYNDLVTTIAEVRYNACLDNRWGLQYGDSDVYGHHNLVKGSSHVALYIKNSSRPSYALQDIREHDSILYHDVAVGDKGGLQGWAVALREEDGASGGLFASVDIDRAETHLTVGTSGDDWYYTRADAASAATHTVSEWDALGYETNPDRAFDIGVVSPSVVTEYDLAVGNETNPYGGNHNAFPTAMGWGKDTEGARSPGTAITTHFVTNRNDSGAGSLRAAMEASGPRIIIPLVGGYVDILSSIVVTDGSMTFLGQFLPAGTQGLWIRNRATSVMGSCVFLSGSGVDHIIVRFLGIPRGIDPSLSGDHLEENGNAWIHNGNGVVQQYAVWDHCTTAFTTDNAVVHHWNDYVTVQNNAFLDPVARGADVKTDPLGQDIDHDFGPHLFGTDYCLFLGNYMTRTRDRTPLMNVGPQVAWGNFADNTYIGPWSKNNDGAGQDKLGIQNKHDWIRNYHREGPFLSTGIWARISPDNNETTGGASVYQEANDGDNVTDGVGWQWLSYQGALGKSDVERVTAYPVPGTIPVRTAEEWRDYVYRWAGVKYVIDPDTGDLVNREWSLHATRLAQSLTRSGPSTKLHSDDVEAFYTSDAVDTWAISGADASAMEESFWSNYYEPWASANGYGTRTAAETVDATTGYTHLELYMMALTPVYDHLTWDSLTWTA